MPPENLTAGGAPALHFADAAAWEAWLAAHHAEEGAVWLKIAKKGSPVETVTIREALDVALCHGWIDSHRKAHDEHVYLQRYSRRRRGSPWSRVNVERVEALTAAGRMRPPGLAEVAAARADGRWDAAYAAQRGVEVPPDLAEALAAEPQAATRFARLGKTARYHLILPLLKARTPAGRAAALRRAIDGLLQDAVETRSTRSG
ncbi:YdeI/OmpD-associated family protein [Nonomuraea sp. MCN248]|uniref:YdeI/OmpD-associated family protein n=1 Tax=Nonomuraea corallina TaxID=2989783 RepID=A0ABT4SNA2_9ACTN|nr:YdeI/OmpD-associated family protein [Nonomuraea corallina]MDA0638721.1 YdeI/OmpD-associated family protein [Nonomuraea corallina]